SFPQRCFPRLVTGREHPDAHPDRPPNGPRSALCRFQGLTDAGETGKTPPSALKPRRIPTGQYPMLEKSGQPLWTPSPERVAACEMTRFRKELNGRHGLSLGNYRDLHAWSVAHPAEFWDAVWDFCGVIGEKGERRLVDGGRMPGAKFFPDARLNFAENLMRRHDGATAIVFRGEDKAARKLTFAE